jgi:hypothetical protein
MASIRLSDALAAVYDVLAAALEPTPSGQPGITIDLGLSPSAAADPLFIVVGHDGSLSPDGSLSETAQAGTLSVKFTASGQPPLQQEDGIVHVVLVSQTGDSGDLPGRIGEAQDLLAACNDAVADLKSGDMRLEPVSDVRLYTRQAVQGCVAEFAFSVGYSAPWD